jgi:sugar/nucleoside kinase (ribokinase family)
LLVLLQASRLGLNVGSIGHVGRDVYGRYMDRIMQQECIHSVMRIMPSEAHGTSLDDTLLCFVLVDPHGRCGAQLPNVYHAKRRAAEFAAVWT